jgi:hypothetical protein
MTIVVLSSAHSDYTATPTRRALRTACALCRWMDGTKPAYRAMDGAYVDNTALVPAVATMIQDCAAGHLDCTSTLPKLVLVNDDMGLGGSGSFHGSAGGISQFFNHPGSPPVGSSADGPAFGSTIASPRIFAESYDTLTWGTYNDHSPIDLSDPALVGAHVSRYTVATLTTIDNPYWGITAGFTLRVAIFNLGSGATGLTRSARTAHCAFSGRIAH